MLMNDENATNSDMKRFIENKFSVLNENISRQEDIFIKTKHFNKYDMQAGVKLNLIRIMGLTGKFESRYFQVYGEVLDLSSGNKPLGRFLSQNQKMDSFVRYSEWRDESVSVFVPKMENVAVVLRLYSFKPEYTASWEKEPEGRLTGSLDIGYETPDAWTICSIFTDKYCDSGVYQLPLFKGGPSKDCFSDLEEMGFSLGCLKDLMEEGLIKPLTGPKGNAVLTLKVMDGHFTDDTFWSHSPEFEHDELLELVGGKKNCCMEVEAGKTWQDFVLSSFPQKVKIKGPSSKKYVEVASHFNINLDL